MEKLCLALIAVVLVCSAPLMGGELLTKSRASATPTPPPPPPNPEDFIFKQVHEVPGLSKDDIYNRALEWMAKTFLDSKAVIEIKDPENGKIVGKGITFVRSGIAMLDCRFTLTIDVKDGRYRTTYENFVFTSAEHGDYPVKKKAMADRIKKESLAPLDEGLATEMLRPAESW